jgi:Domain of unknown function (DUF4126)
MDTNQVIQAGMAHVPELALAGALAWGAGLRLYAVLFIFGIASYFGHWQLPDHLSLIAHPAMLGASGFMATVELFADKLPWLDSIWDSLQTFIRIPAGAAMTAAVFGDSGPAIAMAAALLGGSLTATTHFAKSGTRAVANSSPEPFSNIALSLTEDVAVVGGTYLATQNPEVFLVCLGVFVIVAVILIRLVYKGIKRVFGRLKAAF